MIWTPHCCCWTMHLAEAAVQCPPAAAMIRIILLMMAAPKTMAQENKEQVTCFTEPEKVCSTIKIVCVINFMIVDKRRFSYL